MRRQLKTCAVALIAVFMLCAAAAATASATELELPTIHMALGEGFPVKGEGELSGEGIAQFSSVASAGFKSSGVKLLLEATELSSLFKYNIHFNGIKFGTKECWTEGDLNEVVLVKGEAHLVILDKELHLGVDFLVSNFFVLCGAAGTLKVVLKAPFGGSMIAKLDKNNGGTLEPLKSMEQVTSVFVTLLCTKPGSGKQLVKEYLNDKDEFVKDVITTELIEGGGKEEGCEEIKKPLSVGFNKMVEFLF